MAEYVKRGLLRQAILAQRGTKTPREIAAEVGATHGSVRTTVYLLRKEGWVVNLRRDRPKTDKIAELADGTRTIQEIADLVGTTYTVVSNTVCRMRQAGEKVWVRYVIRGQG